MANTLLLKNAKLLDAANGYNQTSGDILVQQGKMARIAPAIQPQSDWEVVDLGGALVAPGFIDTHAHVYTAVGLGVKADDIGVHTGVTTILDAGSAGPDTMDDFIERDIKTSQTRILSAMHFVRTGLKTTPEADNEASYDVESAIAAAQKYSQYVVAIKARASNSTVGKLGIVPIRAAKQVAVGAGLPLVVHIGNPPPTIQEVLAVMQQGDVITHSYHGKINGLLENGVIRPETQAARERGVRFDVGHGVASFSFNTARAAFAQGFFPDSISTDLHIQNIHGPVFNLTTTMDKMLALGIPLADCVAMVTTAPAAIYRLGERGLGALQEGYAADLTIFALEQRQQSYSDADGNSITGEQSIRVQSVVRDGYYINIRSEK